MYGQDDDYPSTLQPELLDKYYIASQGHFELWHLEDFDPELFIAQEDDADAAMSQPDNNNRPKPGLGKRKADGSMAPSPAPKRQ